MIQAVSFSFLEKHNACKGQVFALFSPDRGARMSIQAMSWAIRQEIVTEPTPRHVLLVLANYAGADGEDAFPSVDRLAKETGMAARTVQRALRVLEDAGLIAVGNQKIAEAKGYAKNRTPTVYRMVMDLIHPENVGRHSVTSQNSGVTNETFRGDTDDIQGRHSVTLTVIEPSIDPLDSLRAKSAATNRKGSRLPLDWQPTQDLIAFAGDLGLDGRTIADSFRDYWVAVPGAKGSKLDWAATWRNWCRNEAKRSKGKAAIGKPQSPLSQQFERMQRQYGGRTEA